MADSEALTFRRQLAGLTAKDNSLALAYALRVLVADDPDAEALRIKAELRGIIHSLAGLGRAVSAALNR